MLRYLSLDIIWSPKLAVFLTPNSQKIVRFSEQIMSADKYQSICLCQMEDIVYLLDLSELCTRDKALNQCQEKLWREPVLAKVLSLITELNWKSKS